METMNLTLDQVCELSHDDLTAILGGVTAKEVGMVVGYAIGFTLGGVVALGVVLIKSGAVSLD